jgi:predicted peptidase
MGISMGGFGVFDMITRYSDRFAAAAPICGGADPKQKENLLKTPIWAFHGEKDVLVDKRHTIVPMEKLKDENHILTKYPTTGHDAWNKAFKEKELLRWMFGQINP